MCWTHSLSLSGTGGALKVDWERRPYFQALLCIASFLRAIQHSLLGSVCHMSSLELVCSALLSLTSTFSCLTWASLLTWYVSFHFLLFTPGVSCLALMGLHSSPDRDGYASLTHSDFPASLLACYILLHTTTLNCMIQYCCFGWSTSTQQAHSVSCLHSWWFVSMET